MRSFLLLALLFAEAAFSLNFDGTADTKINGVVLERAERSER